MKIGIFQDIHANLPALKKSIEIFRQHHCDKIYHVGDLIGIGPYPKECLDLCFATEEMEFIMGNHDYLYPFGIPQPRPELMNEEEEKHQKWTHEQIGNLYKSDVKKWKFVINLKLKNQKNITFQHYGFDEENNWFKDHIFNPTAADLDQMFEGNKSDIIFYGHNHIASDISGNCRYVNLGSAGCYDKPEVRLGILEVINGDLILNQFSETYDDNGLMEEFEIRKVPAREFITKRFIVRE